ncbi:MAG: hypothetical protein ACLTZI_14215 [[Eubacterium] siraeum]
MLNTIITTMRSLPKKVYVSDSLKAIIDLEIDLLLESGEFFSTANAAESILFVTRITTMTIAVRLSRAAAPALR